LSSTVTKLAINPILSLQFYYKCTLPRR